MQSNPEIVYDLTFGLLVSLCVLEIFVNSVLRIPLMEVCSLG